jgi:hypothetical protein
MCADRDPALDLKSSRGWGTAVRWLAAAAALVAAGLAVASHRSDLRESLSRLSAGYMVAEAALVAAFEMATVLSWRAVLAGVGAELPVRVSSRIVLLSALGKYLPGSVWPYIAQVEMGRRYRVPRALTATASVTTVLVGLVTGLVLAAATIPFYASSVFSRYWPVLLTIPVLATLLYPAIFNRLVGWTMRLIRRPSLEVEVTARSLLRGAGWSLISWLAAGLQVWLLARSMDPQGFSGPLLCIGGYALAWSAGFLVVIAPAGAGVRDVVLTAILSTGMSTTEALSVALLSRALTTVGDAAGAAIAVVVTSLAPSTPSGHDDPAPAST